MRSPRVTGSSVVQKPKKFNSGDLQQAKRRIISPYNRKPNDKPKEKFGNLDEGAIDSALNQLKNQVSSMKEDRKKKEKLLKNLMSNPVEEKKRQGRFAGIRNFYFINMDSNNN